MSALRLRVRGFSLALVLLVSSIAITVGFAIAALSSVSLNLAAQTLNQARASALARGVVAELCYELDQRVWKKNPWGVSDFPDMAYGSDAMRERFRTLPLFPDPDQHVMEGALRAYVDFDRPDYFSVDNLNFAEPCPGYTDKGTARASVAPFSVSLVVNTALGETWDKATDKRHFEAIVSRVWLYAAYAATPSIQLGDGATVRGNVYDRRSEVVVGKSGKPPVVVQGDISVLQPRPLAKVSVTDGSAVSGRVHYGVQPPLEQAADEPMVGEQTAGGEGFKVQLPEPAQRAMGLESSLFIDPYASHPLGPLPGVQEISPQCTASVVEIWLCLSRLSALVLKIPIVGDLVGALLNQHIDKSLEARVKFWHGDPPVQVTDLKQYRGEAKIRFLLAGVNQTVGFGYGDAGELLSRVLVDTIDLHDGAFQIGYSITNHFGVESNGATDDLWTGNKDGPSKIKLDNSVLYVDGDLDIRGLEGNNSALIIKGNLLLCGGKLDSGNKGMLIMARNVVIDADGDFRGVIVARGGMRLRPLSEKRLTVRGGVIAEGRSNPALVPDAMGLFRLDPAAPLVIEKTTLLQASSFTKALNRVGTCRRLVFREVP